ncbi:hypothetical protein ZIOFF_016916 [Zingiber officinale]|uniref:Inhibitor I9 domain-containing protein n=1 Tax=Zingiber officinale TaxID=94328 RepID=A0A8J5HN07_ZINOF|nr:hypothetical protein ZIOFF_016916 [Zingiber officinale]
MLIVHMDQDSEAYATPVQLSSGDRLGALVAKLYIVYLGERKHENPEHVTDSYLDMLTCLLGSKKDALTSIVYSYKHVISGFAAMLTEEQAKQLAESPDVISVQSSRNYELQTTWSWDFLELTEVGQPSEELKHFIDGLMATIRHDVRLNRVTTLREAVDQALMSERDRNEMIKEVQNKRASYQRREQQGPSRKKLFSAQFQGKQQHRPPGIMTG